jgi:nucleoid DNA-binding protein
MAENKATKAKSMSKTAVYKELAATTELEPKQVAAVLEALEDLIKKQLRKGGPGVFALSDMIKFETVRKPATKGGMRPNPFKPGEMMEVKPKPASTAVKVRVLKALKELA